MGVYPKSPVPRRILPAAPTGTPPAPPSAEAAPNPAAPPVDSAVSTEERQARQAVARHRHKLNWTAHVPEFEPLFKNGLMELGLPVPRRGIGLRALVDSMMLESKKDLVLWVLDAFRALLPGPTAWRMAEIWGLGHEGLTWLDADRTFSAAHWPEFSDRVRSAILAEHRRYKTAQEFLFGQHRELPVRMAQRLVFDPMKRADAAQEGCLGLLHAVDKVDVGDTPFANYAQQWVGRAIRNYLLGERFPVHVPVNLASQLLREANRAAPGETTQRPERTLLQPRVPLDTLPAPDSRPLVLPDDSVPSPRDLLNRQEILRIVQDMINQLSDKQREVLVRRYGLGLGTEAETLMNIAQGIGISHQQVSMREKRALEKLGAILRPVFHELYG